ncbi:hypothetical protein QYE76_001280 [Lolium multiflorum]|uniref:GATA-type domain-containing protein n=1 Tax=Lolium multiflorum TaxID=4521 RepID=A0AAD8RLJ0_LOLMU|nr:hypothetical protein QYE76_001280 [Lolium multiflorum]
MDVHRLPNAAAAAAAGLGDLFPHEPAMENEDSNTVWLSGYLEDCLSRPASYPVSPEQAAGKPGLPHPSSSNPRRKKRSLASVIRESDEEHYVTVFVEPPLLLDQKDWLAESELILPKKEKDQELVQQQEHEEEYKLNMTAPMQFQQEQVVRRCSICLSNLAPQWQGSMPLCSACSLRLKAGNGFISMERCGQEIYEEQDQGRGQDKRRIKKTTHFGDDEEPPQEKKKIKKTAAPVDEEFQQAKRKFKKATYVNEELPPEEPVKRCTHCMSYKTPQWRTGPLGPKSLCNACGVRYKSGRLLPEYRPANSPTFVSFMHSNSHKKVMQMRKTVDDM